MDQEYWRPVVGYEGLYEVSSLGRVRSLDHVSVNGSGSYIRKGRMLKQTLDGTYFIVRLGRRKRYVHRLVCEAFYGPCPDGLVCLHGPEGALVNDLRNVSWGTQQQNQGPDRERDGTSNAGERNGRAVLTAAMVAAIRADSRSSSVLEQEYPVTARQIRAVRSGRAWKGVISCEARL